MHPTTDRRASAPWLNGRPPHLPCRRGDLPPAVLFPGDPARVDRLGSVLSGFRILGQNREFRVGIGIYNGVPVGVCSTGIGGPSTEIALVEAAELGCRYALRIGGTGALQASVPLGSLLVVNEAVRGGGAAALYAPLSEPALAHPLLREALLRAAEGSGRMHRLAKVRSVDGYYAGQGRVYPNAPSGPAALLDLLKQYEREGTDALDMESETVLVVGAKLGLIAGAILAVHANRAADTWLEDFEPAQDAMIAVACQALHHLCSEERSTLAEQR